VTEYVYKDLTKEGYEHFRISRKEQNDIFEYRKWEWSCTYDYYYKDKTIVIECIPNIWGCIASTLLLPLGMVLEGLSSTKDIYHNMVTRTWQAKKYGAFSSDTIYKREWDEDGIFDKLLKCKEYK